MNQKLLQQITFLCCLCSMLMFSAPAFGQAGNTILFQAGDCGVQELGATPMVLTYKNTDATGRHRYENTTHNVLCQWNNTIMQWEFIATNFPPEHDLICKSAFQSFPNPPDEATGNYQPGEFFGLDCVGDGSNFVVMGTGTQDNLGSMCVDGGPPTITCPATQNRDLNGSCVYTIEDFTSLATNVTDDCTMNPAVTQSPTAGGSITMPGTTPVTLTATDNEGNTTSCNFNLVVADNVSPTVTCPTIDFSATVTVLIIRGGGTPADVFFNITDAGNNVVASEVQTSSFGFSSFAYNLPCDANYTFNYTDNSGGMTQNVQVQVNNTPVITLAPIVTGAYSFTIAPCNAANPGTCSVVLSGLAPTVNDNCATTTTYSLTGATVNRYGQYRCKWYFF